MVIGGHVLRVVIVSESCTSGLLHFASARQYPAIAVGSSLDSCQFYTVGDTPALVSRDLIEETRRVRGIGRAPSLGGLIQEVAVNVSCRSGRS